MENLYVAASYCYTVVKASEHYRICPVVVVVILACSDLHL